MSGFGWLLLLLVSGVVAPELFSSEKEKPEAEAAPLRALMWVKIDAYKNEEKLRERST